MQQIFFKLVREDKRDRNRDAALITVTVDEHRKGVPKTPKEAMDRICKAVAKWIEKSKDGAEAYHENAEEFNIADLADWVEDPNLALNLMEQDILKLEITIENLFDTVLNDFTFDTNLPHRVDSFVAPEDPMG